MNIWLCIKCKATVAATLRDKYCGNLLLPSSLPLLRVAGEGVLNTSSVVLLLSAAAAAAAASRGDFLVGRGLVVSCERLASSSASAYNNT